MENAAMAAYLKDVENNARDMTAQTIINEKMNRMETKETSHANFNRMSPAAVETNPRFKSNTEQFSPKVDPCDPARSTSSFPRVQQQPSSDNRAPGKSKANKTKGKGKKSQELDDRPTAPVRKLWYEALSPEGYTYYWHIETNESVWDPPEEGYMTFAEQEEEAKEEALQKELMKQMDHEETIEKADILEEQRANAEREKMREFRKRHAGNVNAKGDSDGENVEVKRESVEEERPYLRDYSVPERPQPYGTWQVVKPMERKPVDLQLPKQKQIQLPTFAIAEPPSLQKTFKEKTVTQISTGDSDDEETSTIFKKRKIGNKNVRKRRIDD